MLRSRAPTQNSVKRAEENSVKRAEVKIAGRPLWGIASPRNVGSVGRSSTASTRIDSPSPRTSTTPTASSPMSPQHDNLPDILKNVSISDKGDDSSSFGATDSEDRITLSASSDNWKDVHVDAVMAKLQNLMNMASEQLEKTGRRASRDGRRDSAGRRNSRRPSKDCGSKVTDSVATSVAASIATEARRASEERRGSMERNSQAYGSERRSSIESSGSVMCEMLDMVAEDLALITADMQHFDADSLISELRQQLEVEAANTRAAQEEVALLRAKLLEKELELEFLKLEPCKELRPLIDADQVQCLRDELDLLRVEQSELACKQQENALVFESVCVRSGLTPRMMSRSGSCAAPCETIAEDQDDAAKSSPLPVASETAKTVVVLDDVDHRRASATSEVPLIGSLTALAPSTSSRSLMSRKGSPLQVRARELRPTHPAAMLSYVPTGASVQDQSSLSCAYLQQASPQLSPVVSQKSSLRFGLPSTPVAVPSTRNSLGSQSSCVASPTRVVQVTASRSRGSSPARSIASPMLLSPPNDSRTSRPESLLEATSFCQTASATMARSPRWKLKWVLE